MTLERVGRLIARLAPCMAMPTIRVGDITVSQEVAEIAKDHMQGYKLKSQSLTMYLPMPNSLGAMGLLDRVYAAK